MTNSPAHSELHNSLILHIDLSLEWGGLFPPLPFLILSATRKAPERDGCHAPAAPCSQKALWLHLPTPLRAAAVHVDSVIPKQLLRSSTGQKPSVQRSPQQRAKRDKRKADGNTELGVTCLWGSAGQGKLWTKARKTWLRGMRLWNSFPRKMEVELALLLRGDIKKSSRRRITVVRSTS